jgi:hypothetical protein
MKASLTGRGLQASLLVLSRFPLPHLAQATDALLNDKPRLASLPRDRVKALKAQWTALLAANPELLPSAPKPRRGPTKS